MKVLLEGLGREGTNPGMTALHSLEGADNMELDKWQQHLYRTSEAGQSFSGQTWCDFKF